VDKRWPFERLLSCPETEVAAAVHLQFVAVHIYPLLFTIRAILHLAVGILSCK
jgi:hypothetical protein